MLPFMILFPALPLYFKAEHVDPAGEKASSRSSCCQSMAEQEVVGHSFSTDSCKPGELKDACKK